MSWTWPREGLLPWPWPVPRVSLTLDPCLRSFDDIDLPSAVKYLMASDPNLQVLGAAYIQHKCYSDAAAKRQVLPHAAPLPAALAPPLTARWSPAAPP